MGHAQPRVTLVDMEYGWEFHTTVVFVIRVAQFIKHVAVYRVGNPCLDQLEQVLIIEGSIDPVLSHRCE